MKLASTLNRHNEYDYILEEGGPESQAPDEVRLTGLAIELAGGKLITPEVRDSFYKLGRTTLYTPAKALVLLHDNWNRLLRPDLDAAIDAELREMADPDAAMEAELLEMTDPGAAIISLRANRIVRLTPPVAAVAMTALEWLKIDAEMPRAWDSQVTFENRMDATTVLNTYYNLQGLQETGVILNTQTETM